MRFKAKIQQRFGCFESQQPTAHDSSFFYFFSVINNLVQIFNRTINKNTVPLDSFNRWDKRTGAGSQNEVIIMINFSGMRLYSFVRSINFNDKLTGIELN